MCLIIDKPANTKTPKDVVNSAIEMNRDGFGIMYAEHGKLIIERSLDSAWFTERIRALKSKPLIAHCRFATHGSIDLANCHPFLVTDDIAMVHNGVLANFGNSVVSDTAEFVERILRPLLTEFPHAFGNPTFTRILESMIGHGNKMILLRADGETWSLNRDEGLTYNGVWLSNTYAWKRASAQSVRASFTYDNLPTATTTAKRLWDNLPSERYTVDYDDYQIVTDEELDEELDVSFDYHKSESDEQSVMTFNDLGKLSYVKLLDLCYEDPDLVADLVFFAFNY